jgi:hypothetical protein
MLGSASHVIAQQFGSTKSQANEGGSICGFLTEGASIVL